MNVSSNIAVKLFEWETNGYVRKVSDDRVNEGAVTEQWPLQPFQHSRIGVAVLYGVLKKEKKKKRKAGRFAMSCLLVPGQFPHTEADRQTSTAERNFPPKCSATILVFSSERALTLERFWVKSVLVLRAGYYVGTGGDYHKRVFLVVFKGLLMLIAVLLRVGGEY